MVHYAYLALLLVSLAGVSGLCRPWPLGRLARTLVATVGAFLAFDLVGAWRGWFFSNPAFSVAILPPGIPLEEPVLLAFLTILSVALWRTVPIMLGRP